MKELPDHFKTDQRGTAYAGDHMLIELWDAHNLTDAGLIEQTLTRAVGRSGDHRDHRDRCG